MTEVTMYTTSTCPYCRNAKALLASKNISYKEINVELDMSRRKEMMALSGRRTVPQIFVGEHHVGGFDDLAKLDRQGQLMALFA
ncbi:glutaredoxin 3 [Pseudomonas sp. NA-150]|uniref:glutaredoxin 3 n=1 Tax=Pseudomonas sp. NA-150 TaxID=3367525 RepID=UPI0037CB1CC5